MLKNSSSLSTLKYFHIYLDILDYWLDVYDVIYAEIEIRIILYIGFLEIIVPHFNDYSRPLTNVSHC